MFWSIKRGVCVVVSCVFMLSAQDCFNQVSEYAVPIDM